MENAPKFLAKLSSEVATSEKGPEEFLVLNSVDYLGTPCILKSRVTSGENGGTSIGMVKSRLELCIATTREISF